MGLTEKFEFPLADLLKKAEEERDKNPDEGFDWNTIFIMLDIAHSRLLKIQEKRLKKKKENERKN